jgi:hypothetical protein
MSADPTSAAFAWKSRRPKVSRADLVDRSIDMIVDATLIKRDARREPILDVAQRCRSGFGFSGKRCAGWQGMGALGEKRRRSGTLGVTL